MHDGIELSTDKGFDDIVLTPSRIKATTALGGSSSVVMKCVMLVAARGVRMLWLQYGDRLDQGGDALGGVVVTEFGRMTAHVVTVAVCAIA